MRSLMWRSWMWRSWMWRRCARCLIPSSSCLRDLVCEIRLRDPAFEIVFARSRSRDLASRCDFHFGRRGTKLGQSPLDRFIDAPLGKLRSDPQPILDRVRVGRAVRDNAHALQAQQRRATVFGVVDALLEIGKSAAR